MSSIRLASEIKSKSLEQASFFMVEQKEQQPVKLVSIPDRLNQKHQKLFMLQTSLNEQLEPVIQQQGKCPKRIAAGFGFVGAVCLIGYAIDLFTKTDLSTFDYFVIVFGILAACWLIFKGVNRCRNINAEIISDVANANLLEARTINDIKSELTEITIDNQIAPIEYILNLRREDAMILVEKAKYKERSEQRFAFFSAKMHRNNGELTNFIRNTGGATLSSLTNEIFEFAEMDIWPYPNRYKLKQLFEPLTKNDEHKNAQVSFFRRLHPFSNSNNIFFEKKVVERILSFI